MVFHSCKRRNMSQRIIYFFVTDLIDWCLSIIFQQPNILSCFHLSFFSPQSSMAEQRQPFRFRLPWLSAPMPPPRPATEPQPRRPAPIGETQTSQQPITFIQRPPFRSIGIAPAQSPPPVSQETQRTEIQPPPISRLPIETRGASQQSLPSRGVGQPQTASQPTSPLRAPPQPGVASLPPSPTKPALKIPFPAQSPARWFLQPTGRTASIPSSPTSTSTRTQSTEVPFQSSEQQITAKSTQSPQLIFRQEPKPLITQQLLEQPQPKPKLPSAENSKTFENNAIIESFTQPNLVPIQPTQVPKAKDVETHGSQKLDSNTIKGDSKSIKESEKETRKSEEGAIRIRVITDEGKGSSITHKEPIRKRVNELLIGASAASHTKDLPGDASRLNKEQQKQGTFDRKEIISTFKSDGKQIKSMSSTHPKERSTSTKHSRNHLASKEERPSPQEEIRQDMFKFVHKLATGNISEEKLVSVMTLIGNNIGASMHSSSELPKRDMSVNIQRRYKTIKDESSEITPKGEGLPKTKVDELSKTFMNSNAQGVNDSILFNSYITERNPGVHMVLSFDPIEPNKSIDETNPFLTHKVEHTITPAKKLTYEPMVRKQCIKGKILESSASDTDNSEKPEHHGHHFNSGENDKDKDIGIL